MSESNRAVFMSYASQDAAAAKRIAEALRAAGVEVWLDQSELVGGDAWDAKIRKQIKDCALLIPVISANTQARTEGYFRLEWRLADQRTHLMAKGRAFLLPVVIDDTRDAEAQVPDSFTEVQWTRLPGGEDGGAFAVQVKKLLSGDGGHSHRVPPASSVAASTDPVRPGKQPWLLPVIVASVVVVAGLIWWSREPKPAPVTPVSSATSSPASAELARVRSRILPDRWQKGDFEAIAPTLDRLLQANPEDADAWALSSIVHSLQVVRLIDPGTKPLENGKAAAERALRLSPDSPLAHLARGLHLVAMISRGGDPLACRGSIDRAVAALPPDSLTRYVELVSYWLGYDFEGTDRSARAWLEIEPAASFPAWILVSKNLATRQATEMERWARQSVTDPNITGIRTLLNLTDMSFYLRADLSASRAMIDRVPAPSRSNSRVVHLRWQVAMAEERWDAALQELALVPDAMLFDVAYNGPKAFLAGQAHLGAGRREAAMVQFREAERLLREALAADPDNEALRVVLAATLALAGRGADARNELALVEPLVRERAPNVYRARLIVAIAQAYLALGDNGPVAFWLRKLFAEPSSVPFTPRSLQLDPRFKGAIKSPEIQALLQEFAALDSRADATAADKSVAVLAFANLSDDKANEYFSDGISEELLNVLAKVPGLKVSARTSAFYFKGKEVPVPEIARQLGVAYVVEGSVRKSGDKVRITAQLIKAADGFHVWSDTFTRDLKDIFAVQDEIAGLIAQQLQLKLGEGGARGAVDPALYELLLQARALTLRESNEDWRQATALYRRTLEREPRLALAWAEMARTYVQLGRFGGMPIQEAMQEARAAAQWALELEPDQPTGLVAMGWVQRTADWDWRAARRSFQRARELAPGNASIMGDLAVFYFNTGRVAEATALARQAVERDPLNARAQASLGFILNLNGDWEQALDPLRQAVALAPSIEEVRSHQARALMALGRMPEAAAAAEQEPNEAYRLIARAFIPGPAADAALAEFVARYGEEMPGYVANIHGIRGEIDPAFAWFERALARRDAAVVWVKTNINNRSLRADPRWPAFLRKIGLTDDQLK